MKFNDILCSEEDTRYCTKYKKAMNEKKNTIRPGYENSKYLTKYFKSGSHIAVMILIEDNADIDVIRGIYL